MKESNELTNRARKYLGKMIYQSKEIYVYYISKDKQIGYITQVINDIQKMTEDKNVIIFIDNMKILNDNQKFIFGKESTVIIKPTNKNLKILQKNAYELKVCYTKMLKKVLMCDSIICK